MHGLGHSVQRDLWGSRGAVVSTCMHERNLGPDHSAHLVNLQRLTRLRRRSLVRPGRAHSTRRARAAGRKWLAHKTREPRGRLLAPCERPFVPASHLVRRRRPCALAQARRLRESFIERLLQHRMHTALALHVRRPARRPQGETLTLGARHGALLTVRPLEPPARGLGRLKTLAQRGHLVERSVPLGEQPLTKLTLLALETTRVGTSTTLGTAHGRRWRWPCGQGTLLDVPPLDAILDIAIIVPDFIRAVAIDCDHGARVVMASPPTLFVSGLLVRVVACLDPRPDGERLLGGIGSLGGGVGGAEGSRTGRAFGRALITALRRARGRCVDRGAHRRRRPAVPTSSTAATAAATAACRGRRECCY